VEWNVLGHRIVMQQLDVAASVASERARLRARAGLPPPPPHYHRPAEPPFLASERNDVTILLGGLTSIHDRLVTAVFQTCGYRSANLATPDLEAFQLGRQYCNVGQCNPAYFTIGNLIKFLQGLEAAGRSREQIISHYAFFTSGTCGPCRFGMYEAEYRFALKNAGFDGFRVLTFQQNAGVKATSGEPGLDFSLHFGLTALNAFYCGDVLHAGLHRLRPYALDAEHTSRVFDEVVALLHERLRIRKPVDILDHVPGWLAIGLERRPRLRAWLGGLLTFRHHLRGQDYVDALAAARARLAGIEVDRLRVKPIVKVTGEFWAATTDGAGNFDMFRFLEREGAEIRLDPVGGWVMYLLHQAGARASIARRLGRRGRLLSFAALANELRFARKQALFRFVEWFWNREYHRAGEALGGLADRLPPQRELARLAHPFYHSGARGGEGHLEVGKTIYYTTHRKCHMVLSLKPFGCLPSTQSDGAQSAVAARLKDLNFLSIETSGEGELNAHSRVQMALGEAKAVARREFDAALARTGRTLEEIRAYAADHAELRRPFYRVPAYDGVAGTAANFVLHVGRLMDGRR
jgi:predicted nucleotide-binding protein (sugar kinase/HSP70/actin superfamily)